MTVGDLFQWLVGCLLGFALGLIVSYPIHILFGPVALPIGFAIGVVAVGVGRAIVTRFVKWGAE